MAAAVPTVNAVHAVPPQYGTCYACWPARCYTAWHLLLLVCMLSLLGRVDLYLYMKIKNMPHAMNHLLLAVADTTLTLVKQDQTSRQGSGGRRQTMWLDEDIPSTDDEEERTEKRVKLTEAAQAVGEQVAALQVSFFFMQSAFTSSVVLLHMRGVLLHMRGGNFGNLEEKQFSLHAS